jgi:hypothetical protein
MEQKVLTKVRTDFTPEQMDLFADLLTHANGVALKTFVPLVLHNREEVVEHFKEAKKDIDKLLETI